MPRPTTELYDQFQDPEIVKRAMAEMVNGTDACMTCGYQFGYEFEGCADCLPITNLLAAVNATFLEET